MQLNGLEKNFKTTYFLQEEILIDFEQTDKQGNTPLFFAIKNNKYYNLNEVQWNYLLKNSNLNHKNTVNCDILFLIFLNYLNQNISFSKEQWDYIIKNMSPFEEPNPKDSKFYYHYMSVFNLYQFLQSKQTNLNISFETWDFLLNMIKDYHFISNKILNVIEEIKQMVKKYKTNQFIINTINLNYYHKEEIIKVKKI